jgi:hypothetical protein
MMSKGNIYNSGCVGDGMANTLISLRISKDLLKESEAMAKVAGFSNTQEFIRDAIRKQVEERRQRIIEDVGRLYGSAKRGTELTPAARDELARQVVEDYAVLKRKLDAMVASAKKVKPRSMTPAERDRLAREFMARGG